MKVNPRIGLRDVQAVYSGPEGQLWELVMGQQIHVGGLRSSQHLAQAAGIGAGMRGVDLCCCNGAGMRFLLRFCSVQSMTGVDATEVVLQQARCRCAAEGLAEQTSFVLADVCKTGLPGQSVDFVWGEDAWCYVVDKPALIAEAARLIGRGGLIAFTDWIEGPAGLSDADAARWLAFMKFPNVVRLEEYRDLLTGQNCEVLKAEDTGRFAAYCDLYIKMLDMQLTYDALKIIHFDRAMLEGLAGELEFARQLAHAGKIAQGLFVARKLA